MTFLAEVAYKATNGECPAYNSQVLASLKKAGSEKGCLSVYKVGPGAQVGDLAILTEDLFFDLSQVELKDQLRCEQSKIDDFLKSRFGRGSLRGDIERKVPALLELNQEIQTRISKFQLIHGNLPKNPDARPSAKDIAKKRRPKS